MRLCIFYQPHDYPSWLGKGFLRPAFNLLSKASNYKRNPRDERYMKDLVESVFLNDYQWVEAKSLRSEILRKVEEIVMIWPDGNGYGWLWVEFRVFLWTDKNCKIMVLNGRRRYFQLTTQVWLAYWLRCFLERFWIGELIFSLIFVVVSPVMAGWDLLKGRK